MNQNLSNSRNPYKHLISLFFIYKPGSVACRGNSQTYAHTHIYLDSVTVVVNNQILHLPKDFYLSQNYPNPFNPNTTITYSIPKQSNVAIKIFDLLGREVTTLVNEEKSAGNYKVVFNGSNLSSGVYLYRLYAGNFVSTKKFVLMK